MKILGIDWGLKKIGLSLSEGTLSTPWKTLEVKSLDDAIKQVSEAMEEELVDRIVIGKPEGESGELVKKAVKRLELEGFEVITADETLSTKEAKRLMVEMGFGKKKRADDNAMSAAIILQRYLDEKHF